MLTTARAGYYCTMSASHWTTGDRLDVRVIRPEFAVGADSEDSNPLRWFDAEVPSGDARDLDHLATGSTHGPT